MTTKIPTSSLSLVLSQFGPPEKVLKFSSIPLPSWNENSVFIKFLASPINPSDINAIQGVYPVPVAKSEIKDLFIPGFEGAARVEAIGKNVKELEVGDFVLPLLAGIGTWRREAICDPTTLLKIPNNIPIKAAATIAVNPTSALRMLTDFVQLKPGETIIQNAGNSAVGQAVIQIAKSKEIQTINVIRDRPNYDESVDFLKRLGADYVVKEGELLPFLKDKKLEIKLALNAVGGRSATDLARSLGHGGMMVTYGGMSKEPVIVPTGPFIFKDIQLRGFWMTRWKKIHSKLEIAAMHDELFHLIAKDQLKVPPLQDIPFEKAASDPNLLQEVFQSTGKKKIFVFEH